MFSCSCIACGRLPRQRELGIWVEGEEGVFCERCWKEDRKPGGVKGEEGEHCCFCALCNAHPPMGKGKLWLETPSGCLCEGCLKRVAEEGVERELERMMEEEF